MKISINSIGGDIAVRPFDGVRIIAEPLLPFDETIELCDVKTKRHFVKLTGKKIECIKVFNELRVSQELYDLLDKAYLSTKEHK